MVKKLIKYDFKAFAKVMLPVEIVMLGVALLYRIVAIFENDSVAYDIFNVSAIIILVIAAVTALLMTFIFSIVRFYKNLFTTEGYLSFTLPVTAGAHIISKLIVSLIFDLITLLTLFVSFFIATFGEVFSECLKAGLFLYGKAFDTLHGDLVLYTIELIVLVIAASVAAHLLTFMCVAVGQTAKKHKILLAVGIYFGIYVLKQILGTIFITTGTVTDMFDNIRVFISNHPRGAIHSFFGIMFAVELVFSVVYFFVARSMMKKKLNLE